MQARITAKLTEAFDPTHLEVVNESFKHSVPKGSESHFKVTVSAGHPGTCCSPAVNAVRPGLACRLLIARSLCIRWYRRRLMA